MPQNTLTNAVIYRVQFKTDKNTYDLFVRHVYPSDMHGFICLEEFIFAEEQQRIIDPRTEKLIAEFGNVRTTFIPYHQIIRIDQVHQAGESRISESTDPSNKIRPFPQL
ncbi:DUF1820 family protein [Suttonella ornithocola]|uniref:Uncharacterized protein conserved in bacteria n=1 Tax=Suttonella ornithocola TaxID=279832 RepID=A0A380MNM2_9GAMM|nr:DUF1820 family protein [Suttonella ornithocola]SUO93774.1 Uncharacterized protein conserved in bacteria [Suttonella ornithocola]